ncbi:MAG: DNA polymerase I, partial [Terriglobia bacterium]
MKNRKKRKIFLLDGPSLIYRAFYALPTTLTTRDGRITNAVYGFTSMLIRLLSDEQPDAVLVAFDRPGRTFRHDDYEEYKAHRPETPEELKEQLPLVRDVLNALNIPQLEADGYEADDILGTVAVRGAEASDQVVIVTADRDLLQCVSDNVSVLATRRGITDVKSYDRAAVVERFGVTPEQIPDMLALKGDASDNIPGVPGIGEKTATSLISEYGSLEKVLESADRVAPRFGKLLVKHREQAVLSKKLATLIYNVPIEVDLDKPRIGDWNEQEVGKVFANLDFNTLLERLKLPPASVSRRKLTGGLVLCRGKAELDRLGRKLAEAEEIAYQTVFGDPNLFGSSLEGFFFGVGETAYYLPAGAAEMTEFAREWLVRERPAKVVYDGKHQVVALVREGIRLKGVGFDVLIGDYLLKPTESARSLEKVIDVHLDADPGPAGSTEAAGRRVLSLAALKSYLAERLADDGLMELFRDTEMPLSDVLARMELDGVAIDSPTLIGLSKEIEGTIKTLEADVQSLAGGEFNLNSPSQLREVLFERLGLKGGKKTKTGFSTDSSVLSSLVDDHPIVEKILSYRELTKLKSTYLDVLPRLADPETGRVHTTFNQAVTATGRLSSSDPNLQNIPVRTEFGRRVRAAFVAPDGHKLLVADYSQIELRLLAHLSKDANLISAFTDGKDIHTATASEVFGVPGDDVTAEMRRKAKVVNFGIIYGISGKGLEQRLKIPRDEADTYIKSYFERYPGVKQYIDEAIARAHREGFAVTLLGRRRSLPELKSGRYQM